MSLSLICYPKVCVYLCIYICMSLSIVPLYVCIYVSLTSSIPLLILPKNVVSGLAAETLPHGKWCGEEEERGHHGKETVVDDACSLTWISHL